MDDKGVTKDGQTIEKSVLWMMQNGEKIVSRWNRENPGDLPELEQTTVNRKKVWDKTKRLEFLETYIQPYLSA